MIKKKMIIIAQRIKNRIYYGKLKKFLILITIPRKRKPNALALG